eukprot:CAMPEP_0113719256 /NCGR_PEP_ID=MMETSP0038_2-20120614/35688_1 /TAXON_ID=2898 /ORGANISM="Cryptomonas paramecium" /LENGTH=38 /DNA_ID=CAMNT_0000647557 /DNA_START=77 /DNA_END=189 /DNA_ORIENTATION=- /assembly_acc=CAM_ASM_000170
MYPRIPSCAGQERNYYGKIFGGFLMREAYEIALTAANA